MITRDLVILLLLTGIVSCNSTQEKSEKQSGPDKKEMAELNKYMVQKDRERISNYLKEKDCK